MKKQLTKEDALKKIKELEEYIESLDKELKLAKIHKKDIVLKMMG